MKLSSPTLHTSSLPPLPPPNKTKLAMALRDIFRILKCQLHDYTLYTLIFILETLPVNDQELVPDIVVYCKVDAQYLVSLVIS